MLWSGFQVDMFTGYLYRRAAKNHQASADHPSTDQDDDAPKAAAPAVPERLHRTVIHSLYRTTQRYRDTYINLSHLLSTT